MTKQELAKVLALVSGAYAFEVTPMTTTAWMEMLGAFDGKLVYEATAHLCARDISFPPRPGEIIAEMERVMSPGAPSVDAALGYYLAGRWDVHPFVGQAARQVQWDPHGEKGDQARWDFKAVYRSLLEDDDLGTRRVRRQELTGEVQPLAIALGEAAPVKSTTPAPAPTVDLDVNKAGIAKARAAMAAAKKAAWDAKHGDDKPVDEVPKDPDERAAWLADRAARREHGRV